ncbi:hypothetical protein XavaCFBP5823_00155 [Xanthomonas axonopodis pv. vasculorum]|nr:hypothetical protein XavaCFBP5823_00155 [Xanthomonas axonopodis pv. vasculorum]
MLPCTALTSVRDGPSEHHTDSWEPRPIAGAIAHGVGDARRAGRVAMRRPHHAPARPPSLQRRLRISA